MKKILWPLFFVLLFVVSAVAQTVPETLLFQTNGQRERVVALQARVARMEATMTERKAARAGTTGNRDRGGAASTNQSAAALELQRKANEAQAADERARAAAAHIELVEGTAVARFGPHRVTFAANAKTAGAVDLRTRTGERLRSHVLGLGYLEPASGKSVLLAELVDRTGEVLSPNRVIYRDVFDGVAADLLYEYTVSSLEQNVVIRKRLPSSPEEFGLDPEQTQLAVLTEFIESPEPRRTQRTISLREQYAALGITADETLPDVTLSFGSMRIVKGKAFALGGGGGDVPVGKAWQVLRGPNGESRRFLIESVPYRLIKPQLDALSAATIPEAGKTLQASSVPQALKDLLLGCKGPGAKLVDSQTGSAGTTSPPRRERMKLAQAGLKAAPGVVLDYVIIDTSLTGGVWFEDESPPDAIELGDNEWWFWTDYWWDGDGWGGNDLWPYSGSSMHVSEYVPGNFHQHYFREVMEVIQPGPNDVLYAYVNLDSSYPPDEVMLQWREVDEYGSESWEHRAYWGINYFNWGLDNTESRRPKGNLPTAGTWVRLEVPASEVGLVGKIIDGMAFTLYGGRAAWDQAGLDTGDNAWVEDSLPPGAYAMADYESWNWMGSWYDGSGWGGTVVTPYSDSLMHVSAYFPGNYHQHYFAEAISVLQPGPNDVLYSYVNLDSTYPPSEVMLQWRIVENGVESWEHRAYWGANYLNWGLDNTESRRPKGNLPTAGSWVRLEVPACEVGLVGKVIDGMAFTLYGGRAAWDRAGKLNPDMDGDGLPDAWEMQYFGNLNQGANDDYDQDGASNLQEYQNGTDPNTIHFSLSITNQYVKTSSTAAQIELESGVPFTMAVLVDSTNVLGATWVSYNTNVSLNLGSTQGWHEVRVGLRGMQTDSDQTWEWQRFKLDTTPPLLIVTNPVSSTGSRPMIQLQGYSPEALASLSYDITNASGLQTNQQMLVIDRHHDTNTWEFTTNTFQAFDVSLTNGLNTITIHAADLAGNAETTNLIFTLDYSGDTNPPVVGLCWPRNGAQMTGTNFTWRGWVDDFTATLTATLVDTNGNTNVFNALVERDGSFWLEELPLAGGTNILILLATNAAGNFSSTNISVVKSSVSLTIDPVPEDNLWNTNVTVTGTINVSDHTVWVNGVKATNNGNGTWTAEMVPLTPGGTAVFQARAIPNSDNGGNGTGGSGGVSASYDDPGNPASVQARDGETQSNKPTRLYVGEYSASTFDVRITDWQEFDAGGNQVCWGHLGSFTTHGPGVQWKDGEGGTGWWTAFGWGQDCHGTLTPNPCVNTIQWRPTFWPNLVIGTHSASGGCNWDVFDGKWPPPDIRLEHCALNVSASWGGKHRYHPLTQTWEDWNIDETYSRNAQAKMKLFTGGKAVPGRENLFEISATAKEWRRDYYTYPLTIYYVPTRDISPQNIIINGKKVGNDGKLYLVLPDNVTTDVTPDVARVKYYTFTLDATKHRLNIAANGHFLAPDRVTLGAKFCVGQKINLESVMVPSIDGQLQNLNAEWILTGGFVNYIENWAFDAKKYLIDWNLTFQKDTHAWWYAGGEKHLSVIWNMTFNNGQTAKLTTTGRLNMHRPQVTSFTDMPPHFAWVNTNRLHFGRPWLQLGLDNGNATGSTGFRCEIKSDFSGDAGWTQLINAYRNRDETYPLGSYTWSTDGQYWLDGSEFYSQSIQVDPPPVYTPPLAFGDQPGWPVGLTVCTINDQFRTYLRFRPGGSDSIWVTLGRVDWSWSATAALDAEWGLTSQYVPTPQFQDNSEFPFWLNYVSSFDF